MTDEAGEPEMRVVDDVAVPGPVELLQDIATNAARTTTGPRIVAKIGRVAPNFPDLIERQLNYPAYTNELMFGCTGGDFTHGLLPL